MTVYSTLSYSKKYSLVKHISEFVESVILFQGISKQSAK